MIRIYVLFFNCRYRIFFKEFDNLDNIISPGDNQMENKSKSNIFEPKFDKMLCTSLTILDNINNCIHDETVHSLIANNIKSIIQFSKITYADMMIARSSSFLEILNSKSIQVCRNKLIECIKHTIYQTSSFYETVYDLDSLVVTNRNKRHGLANILRNNNEIFIQRSSEDVKKLQFESRFESGNLRKAIRVCIYTFV